ncbi:FabD/lysophospholipase-like protein [Xylariomycetidae sp. FL0641]|nr:FabD/lysophospholipase-like protein [Xylariomycetidae sp. FL0641]
MVDAVATASQLDSVNNSHFQGDANPNGPWLQKIVLSFDGGGIRGYWSLLVLQYLMKAIRDKEAEGNPTRSSFSPCEEPPNVSHHLSHKYTHFLPCHYFDYVGGTSTGGLIAILLSRFRMTVEDCIQEYENMAGKVFKSPRPVHRMNAFVLPINKYSRDSLERVLRTVIKRRVEATHADDSEVLFETEIDTCRGIVLAIRRRKVVRDRFLFRSYTPYSEKKRQTGSSRNDTAGGTTDLKNPLNGVKISALKVALAGTAAPLYFGHYLTTLSTAQAMASRRAPTTMGTGFFNNQTTEQPTSPRDDSAFEFIDAGFSSANNPCVELQHEIEHHHGSNKPVLVSIGTARPPTTSHKQSFSSTVRTAFDEVGNTEATHEQVVQSEERGDCSYYRFNYLNGLNIEMDEWKEDRTLKDMGDAFDRWLQEDGVETRVRACAAHLVALRRARTLTSRWERFALGQYFVCKVEKCPKDRDNRWLDRMDFENHLRREHKPGDYGANMQEALDACKRIWEYRAAPTARVR